MRRVDASRIENLGERQFAATRFDAQDTDAAVLNPGLHFQLNGAAPVRGYQAGDRGHPLNLELHRLLGAGFSGFVFHDRGGVRTEGVPDQTARSVGAGVDWSWRDSLRANAASRAARAEVLARHHACPGRSERIRNAAV